MKDLNGILAMVLTGILQKESICRLHWQTGVFCVCWRRNQKAQTDMVKLSVASEFGFIICGYSAAYCMALCSKEICNCDRNGRRQVSKEKKFDANVSNLQQCLLMSSWFYFLVYQFMLAWIQMPEWTGSPVPETVVDELQMECASLSDGISIL